VAASDVHIDLHPDDANAGLRARRGADGVLVLVGRIAVRDDARTAPCIEVREKISPACRIGTMVFVERVRGSHSGGP